MSEQQTIPQVPQAPQAPAAPAAPAPKTVTMTEDELHALRAQWKQDAIKERFKNAPDPDEIAALRKERDELAAERAKRADAEKTEIEKLIAARDQALAAEKAAKAEADRKVAEAAGRYDEQFKRTEILRAVDLLKKKGVIAESVLADDVVELTSRNLAVADGKVTGKDQYERPQSVEDYLAAWVSQPARSNYRPPAPAGTGTEPGRAPGDAQQYQAPKTPEEAWSRLGKTRPLSPASRRSKANERKPPPGAPTGALPE